MKRFWIYISYTGLSDQTKTLENRTIILTNQLNLIIFIAMILLFGLTTVMAIKENAPYGFGSLRLLIIMLLCVIIFISSKNKLHMISKTFLIFIPSIVFFILPTTFNFVEQESYYYYPFSAIAFSVIPQLILIPRKNKTLFYSSMGFYFLLIVFIDNILTYFSPEKLMIVDIIDEFYVYYKIAPAFIFLFVHIAIYYLRHINYNYEKELTEYNEELNSALKKLKETQQQLVHSEKMASLGTLTAGVAHEINNPLNFINGGIHIINELKQELNEYLSSGLKSRFNIATNMIKTGMEKASEIVSSLMTFSNRGTVELVPSNINEIIDKTLLFLKPLITDDIILKKEYNLGIKVPVYEEKIHQVIMNVVDNAIYAVNKNTDKKEKRINISTSHVNDKAVIEITNNGPKIPVYDLVQLFDPFFTTKDPGEGTGLGLSISYSLIAEHKGKIYAQNREEGVVFTIELPIKEEE
jgi:signal transduction histidine kinase